MKTIAQQLNVKEFPFVINNSQGKPIYYEDSNGYWRKGDYDSQGNRTYFEDSKGYWEKSEYDSNGYRIYFESSIGVVRDDKPKPCEGKTVEIDGIKYKLVKE
jgi:hypothetical protein